MHNGEEKSWKKKDQIKSWNTNLPRKSWIRPTKVNQESHIDPSSFSRHVRHFVWSFWTSRILVFQQGRGWLSLISRRRLSSTTYHPPLEAGGPSQQGFDGRFSSKTPWDFKIFKCFNRPKLAKNISIICSGQGSFFDDATFFFSMAGAWGEKHQESSLILLNVRGPMGHSHPKFDIQSINLNIMGFQSSNLLW